MAGYKIEVDSENRSMLTNLKFNGLRPVSYFTISELEVWEIIFEK
jgi:hypothetical protein